MAVMLCFLKVLKSKTFARILPRDYLQTRQGLMFAVVATGLLDLECPNLNLIVSCLRYIPDSNGLTKVSTSVANHYLKNNYPQYLCYSKQLDTVLHAVLPAEVQQHFQPVRRLKQICTAPTDSLEELTAQLASLFISQGLAADAIGVSGSILISAHGENSDIDLVVYGRENFFRVRKCLRQLLTERQVFNRQSTRQDIQALTDQEWRQTWERRGSDLSLHEYIWYEQRKYNKASIHGVKFDLSMVESQAIDHQVYTKQGSVIVKAMITNDSKAYDYPASYSLDDSVIKQILCYSATYAGQACNGELIEARGVLEKSANGVCRLVVGSSREASGEYLRVMKSTYPGFDNNKTTQ